MLVSEWVKQCRTWPLSLVSNEGKQWLSRQNKIVEWHPGWVCLKNARLSPVQLDHYLGAALLLHGLDLFGWTTLLMGERRIRYLKYKQQWKLPIIPDAFFYDKQGRPWAVEVLVTQKTYPSEKAQILLDNNIKLIQVLMREQKQREWWSIYITKEQLEAGRIRDYRSHFN